MPKAPRADRGAARRRPHPGEAHPPRPAADHLLLDPAEIVLSGPYVRQHVEADETAALREAILAGGEIQQAIGVRREGPEEAPRFVLVYGLRRWLASREAGLAEIPVRDHGRISVTESLALQVAENEARVDPHPVDTAVSYQLLVQEGGLSQAEVARLAGRSAAHVSYMRAVGEAILRLQPEEREALYAVPEATVPRFQKIAPLTTSPSARAPCARCCAAGSPRSAPRTPGPTSSRPASRAAAAPGRCDSATATRTSATTRSSPAGWRASWKSSSSASAASGPRAPAAPRSPGRSSEVRGKR